MVVEAEIRPSRRNMSHDAPAVSWMYTEALGGASALRKSTTDPVV
jgi:hypothetical protein